jgi:protein-S-isoprenylcysteine O-methyltransferase Ste14
MHIPVPWVFVITYLSGVVLQALVPITLSPSARNAFNLAGWILMAVGVGLAAWCLTIFYTRRTTTVPGQPSSTLVTWGPYRFSRNPMYVALTLAYIGEAGITGQIWPLAVLPLVLVYVNWTLVPFEEAHLAQTFGEPYADYRARVRRWM